MLIRPLHRDHLIFGPGPDILGPDPLAEKNFRKIQSDVQLLQKKTLDEKTRLATFLKTFKIEKIKMNFFFPPPVCGGGGRGFSQETNRKSREKNVTNMELRTLKIAKINMTNMELRTLKIAQTNKTNKCS